jgi:hypothetical protein
MKLIRPFTALSVLAMTAAISACSAEPYPPYVGGYATVNADTVPPDIYTYPHVAYEGSNAYLVNDAWFYPTPRGWVRLRHESPQLARYHADYRAASRPVPEPPREPNVPRTPRSPAYSYPAGGR